MPPFFALTFRGLEPISALEIARFANVHSLECGYRHIRGYCDNSLQSLLNLRTVDDIFLHVATWTFLARQRHALARLQEAAARTDWRPFAETCASLRPVNWPPKFSVSASFVGKRNYSVGEIKEVVAEGVAGGQGWHYTEDDRSADLNIRLFLEHDIALVGVRLGKRPLHQRSYEHITQNGSLKPTIAAAMVFLATHYLDESIVDPVIIDPCCGSGPIPIEAAQMGLQACAGDIEPAAVQNTQRNMSAAQVNFHLAQWDAGRLPFVAKSANTIVSNLPWGRQASTDGELTQFYANLFDEIKRVVCSRGVAVLLTTIPIECYLKRLDCVQKFEISLFGQTPTIWVLTVP
jgi:tRNA (guanine6-N2)-methyltransferase